MSRDHGSFAAELRADAARLREMADALERRAAAHERRAEIEAPRPPIDEEHCAFGLRFLGARMPPAPDGA